FSLELTAVPPLLAERAEAGFLLGTPRCFSMFCSWDLPHHSTQTNFPYLARFAPLSSRQSILRSVRRVQLLFVGRFARSAGLPRRSCAKAGSSTSISTRPSWRCQPS